MKTVSIIGGGWSASLVDLKRLPGTIIGVNDAAILAPRCDIALSMDRLWTEHRFDALRAAARNSYIRRNALQNLTIHWPWLKVFECDHTSTAFSLDASVINGPNSGYCALNLAYQLRPTRVFLVGFDMQRGPNGEAHWYPPYSWAPAGGTTSAKKFAVWAAQLEHAAKQFKIAGIEVFNVTTRSAAKSFKRISPAELLECAT